MEYQFIAPCYFGVEGPAAFDFKRIGAKNVTSQDGRVLFEGDEEMIALANLHSRCTERILIRLATFPATTFDELFDGVKAIRWGEILPKDAAFPVKGSSLSSTLSSVPACQSIVKKAVVEALKRDHATSELPETGNEYRLRFTLRKDVAEIMLDTSGVGLHKRGYRKNAGGAPLKETLAAAIADLARVGPSSILEDPFCGSGTLLIEAALKARRQAPGLRRHFAAEKYSFIPAGTFERARAAALAEIDKDATFEAHGFDIDPAVLEIARDNARIAGVADFITFHEADVRDYAPRAGASVLTNPPYGARLLTPQEAADLAGILGQRIIGSEIKGAYIISGDGAFETHFGKKATKRRKMYNGMLPAQVYMYF